MKPKHENKLCIYCKHFWYETAKYDDSKTLPPIMQCNLNFMKWNPWNDKVQEFRFKMQIATYCEHYEPLLQILKRGY
jgi:hypothetical protein